MAKKDTDKFLHKEKKNRGWRILLIVVVAIALLVAIYFLPPVHDRLSWRIDKLRSNIYYYFNPPQEDPFTPEEQAQMEEIVRLTQTAIAHHVTLTPSQTPTNQVSPTPSPSPSPTPFPTPIPDSKKLEGVVWENQKLYNNNCGPANLSMALSFWGWDGNQTVTAAWLKPNPEDRNVMPEEMVAYVEAETRFNAILRWGGDAETIKKFIAAGYPVLIERGFQEEVPNEYWMGHYNLITGYDDIAGTFLIQDSYVSPDYERSYDFIVNHWREFNYVYIVIYPPEDQSTIYALLGAQGNETDNLNYAAQKALDEVPILKGDDVFFAWFNHGSSLRRLNDYYGAAQSFDKAYGILAEKYPGLDPYYRILWYRTDPYFAYYWTGRYNDLLVLTKKTLNSSFVPAIEESWVWQARAKVELGDLEGAIDDYRKALEWHPNYSVAIAELQALGVTP